MLNRALPPPIKDAVEFDLRLKPYQYFELDNKVPVYAVDAGEQDVIQVELVFYAGKWFDAQKQVAKATNFLLRNGTSTKSAFEINEHFDYYGAYCNRSCSSEIATISLHALTKYLPELLPVIGEMVSDSIFPEEELAVYQQNAKQQLAVNLKKSDFVANRLIDSYLYGSNHPYGQYTTAEDIDAVQVSMLKDFFDKYYRQGNCILFVAGKLPGNLQQQLNDAFGKLSLSGPTSNVAPPIPVQPLDVGKYRHQVDTDGVQSAIRIACPFPNRHHPDYIKVMMLNNIFGGFFGSRLMSNIREDKGYTYGIHSYIQNRIQQTAWVVSTEVGKQVCDAAIEEIYKEMQQLQDELIDDEELQLSRNFMMGTILGDLDGPFHIISRWKNIVLNNLDEKFFYNSMQTIRTISAEELRELARKYLTPSQFYELAVT